jgi:hypothetical protein
VPVTGTIGQPTAINLYPNESSENAPRLTVMITAVGSVRVSMPLGFDTGSAGVTLYAPAIFPASMVNSSGFIFPAGETSMSYNGITVTSQQGTRTYGSVSTRAENGNLGYAQLTFGDAQGELTTQTMPLFLYFSITDNTTGQTIAPAAQQGWFGVAATDGTIVLPDSVEPAAGYPACSPQTTSTCHVVSVLKYLNYASSVHAGFMLTPATIQSCDITSPGSCAPSPVLTIGLTTAAESGFSAAPLVCPPSGYVGSLSIAGYPVCQKDIDDVTINVSGNTVGTLTGYALFDSGTADMQFSTAAGSTFPSSVLPGATILVTTPSGFSYSYIAGSGIAQTVVNADTNLPNIIGISYFTTNSFFIDFSSSTEGWK